MKKTLIALILSVSILALSVPASATSSFYLDDLIYAVSGKITAKIDIKDYVTLSVTIPKVERFEEKFNFFGDGTFMDQLLYTANGSSYTTGISYPTWYQSGNTFTIDLSDLSSSIESALGSYVDISGGPTKSPVITGKISKDGKSINGKMSLGWNISTYVEGYGNISGSITVTMNYKGTYWGYLTYSPLLMKDSGKSESKMAFQKAVKDAVVNVLSALPKKAKQPAQ